MIYQNMLEYASAGDGSLYSIWGPCSDGSVHPCRCPQCENANRIERQGLDWGEEYEKARLRGFDYES